MDKLLSIENIEKMVAGMLEKQSKIILEKTEQLLKDQEKNFAIITSANMKILTERLDKLEKDTIKNITKTNDIAYDLNTTRTRVAFLETEFNEIKKFISAQDEIISSKFETVKQKTKKINMELKDKSEILKISNKLRVMEDRSRRNNLRIDGIKESENESWVESECKVHKLFEECLDIKNIKIERAHRSGPRDVNKHRPIVLKLLNYKDKTEILKKSFKLKGKNIYINEDFSAETTEIRKGLRERMKKERESGKFAVISYDKLVIRDWTAKK
ncbi:uncharacterized protein LOC136076306 [Hydra vulgaris]|uniref:Uncharacterized protein LOC136076306 n=1 Tax=Hydra vulgaris TaxID=6087 RepID=A0ABM4BAB6_HYDVU